MRINARVPNNNSTIEIFGTLDKDKVENITVKYYSNYTKSNHIEPPEITTRLADIFEIRSWTPANNSVTVKAKPNAHIDGANAIFWSMEYKEGKMCAFGLAFTVTELFAGVQLRISKISASLVVISVGSM
jgi:Cft2 family RNA processing exonuclease